MKKLAAVVTLALVAGACASTTVAEATTLVDSQRAEELIGSQEDLVVLDVRTPEEFASGALPNAILIDINSPTFADEIARLDTSKPYLVYCRSGNRSATAVEIMEEAGFGEIYELANGIQAWVGSGRPLQSG